jgi:diguanylate cyclase (GGDEF)-like protein/PAS domain S-box-containing protein
VSRPTRAFAPLSSRGRRPVAAILATFALSSALSVGISIWSTSHSQHQAAVFQIAARQRTLAERYVSEVLIARAGGRADPGAIGGALERSAAVLLDGGQAPAIAGDDDETMLAAQHGAVARPQLEQARRLVHDLAATGAAILRHEPVARIRPTAHERLPADPLLRLRVLAALASNVSLNAARSIAVADDRNISDLITLQVVLGVAGLLLSLVLGWALIRTTRRQTAHFRSLVTSSTDHVIVFGRGGCRYVSGSVCRMTGLSEEELLASGILDAVHRDDRDAVWAAAETGEPHELVFRAWDAAGACHHLEAHVTDLRHDRQIRGVVFNARDVTERLRLEEELLRQAFHDSLTGLPNRALFRDRLEHALARAGRSGETHAVLLVDLDGFKQVNDSLGHDAGDALLTDVASRFEETLRASDTVARLGGDEFAILLEDADERQARQAADRVLASLRNEPAVVAGRELGLSASIGIVTDAGGAACGEALLRDADIAMYAAKEGGRGRYEVFRAELARDLGELLGIEHELRLALDRGEFTLHYQPTIDLASSRVVGLEALLRWRSPTRGNVPPARFIAVAERTGLIVELGAFVLREACTQAAAWRREFPDARPPVTWVNVSVRQLTAGGFDATVRSVLAETGLPADLLGLEITETVLVESGSGGERARTELEALHADGVRIAIDDFGVGFSSLGQLRHFPIDLIKVDRSFVQGSETGTTDATITKNLIGLAHALEVVALAEGIESHAQLHALRELGCDQAQGFLFAQPAPPAEIRGLLARGSIAADASDAADAVA